MAGIAGILWAIVVVLVVLWLVGLFANVLGVGIHTLIVIAVIIAIYNLVTSSRTA